MLHSANPKAETQDVILVARQCTEGISSNSCDACLSAHLRSIVEGVGSEPGLPVSKQAQAGSHLAGPVLGARPRHLPVQVPRIHQHLYTCISQKPEPC